ncbi:type VII secretion target [Micromonospora sp. NPDC049559]|uniref:type VII secretion target n=1 Tax=Micromonospora sp. NPDC049559 TaxID=3155923 RepID=UPI003442710B
MARGVAVPADALVGHAGAVDRIGGEVLRGLDAARQVRLGSDAYGQLCRMLPGMLDPLHDRLDHVLSEARGALDESARSLRTAAVRYEASDADAAVRLGSPGSGDR